MDVLPEFDLIRPRSVDEAVAALQASPKARVLGGGTDLLVNIRRGIGDEPSALIDLKDIAALKTIEISQDRVSIGASARLCEVAKNADVRAYFPLIAEAAKSIAGPPHRIMGTVGGNLALDTRCIYYNQSEWWRSANDFCLKYQGSKCHVAPKSKVCFATFSGDLAPAFLVLDASVDIIGPKGERTIPLNDLYTGDGQIYHTLAPGEFILRVRAARPNGLASGYEKMRVRRSIDYPLAGVAVGLIREGGALKDLRVAITGTNPRPVRLAGADALCGGALDDTVFARLDELMRDQIMAMKTTFTPGHYRRKVAGALAERLIRKIFDGAAG